MSGYKNKKRTIAQAASNSPKKLGTQPAVPNRCHTDGPLSQAFYKCLIYLKDMVVWAVHCEPVCSPKTLFLGNLTGELPNFGIFGPFQREYTHPFQALTNQLPDKNNRSLLRLNRSNGQENRSF